MHVESVNETIMEPQDGLPAFSISAGVTFSVSGYVKVLFVEKVQIL